MPVNAPRRRRAPLLGVAFVNGRIASTPRRRNDALSASVADDVRVLAIVGSPHEPSSNALLLHTTRAVAPAAVEVVIWNGVRELPPFSPDVPVDLQASEVMDFRRNVAFADVVLVATPEYAGGMPGTLKNAFDWLVETGELYGKPVVIVSAAPSVERGHGARRWTQETLQMQGGIVAESFTVALRSSDTIDMARAAARAVLAAVDAVRLD